MARSKRPRRRGVILLVVMCMLILFLLLTVTYVIVASKERGLSRTYMRNEDSGDTPQQTIDSIAMSIFRDTNDLYSPFRSWSLLEGIYGNTGFRAYVGGLTGNTTVSGQQPVAGGQFLTIIAGFPKGSTDPFNNSANYYKGCVLTMLSGPCAGLSTRIVASGATASGQFLTVMRFQSDAGLYDPNTGSANAFTGVGDIFLVNGRPYSGMGRGYDTTQYVFPLNSTTPSTFPADGYTGGAPSNLPYAFLPNPIAFTGNSIYGYDPAGPGGDNPDYTAYDFQNIYLGLVTNSGGANGIPPVLPSYFHPELYNYISQASGGSLANSAQLQRAILFRPNHLDHPMFTTNTNLPLSNALASSTSIPPNVPLDVDNMGTGTADSIWIDPGLPVFKTRDGRTYKVLVAPLILDMDGRLNVNAHGSYAQMQNSGVGYSATGLSTVSGAAIAGPTGTATVPLNQGYGPPDANLLAAGLTPQEIAGLIGGNGTYNGRYGNGTSPISHRGEAWLKFFEYPPKNYQLTPATGGSVLSAFGSPPDLKGQLAIAQDPMGWPVWGGTTGNANAWANDLFDPANVFDNPYGLDLSLRAPRPGRPLASGSTLDNPFTPGELEAALRPRDVDARTLPQRLLALMPSLNPQNQTVATAFRNFEYTTDSWDVPAPSVIATRELRHFLSAAPPTGLGLNPQFGNRSLQITDLVRARFKAGGGTLSSNVPDSEIAKLIAPELIGGVRMDINRPFGNGRDDSAANTPGYNDVDEAHVLLSSAAPDAQNDIETLTPSAATAASGVSVPFPNSFPGSIPLSITNGNGALNGDPLLANGNLSAGCKARQLMARHLYALMMLFADTGFVRNGPSTGQAVFYENAPQAAQPRLIAHQIAQWAINVVSFRDSTSIMTPFVYHWDIYQPTYGGWTADGDPKDISGNEEVVWGCKPPDVVLTETVSFHDRRTADTALDNGSHKKRTDTPADPTFDQVQIPQGSTFIELLCVRNPNNPVAPGDLYQQNGSGQWSLNLSKMAPAGAGIAYPVWRMGITSGTGPFTLASPPKLSVGANANSYDVAQQWVGALTPHPDTTTFEPNFFANFPTLFQNENPVLTGRHMNLLSLYGAPPANAPDVPIERVIWLGQQTPPTGAARNNVFYYRAAAGGSTLLAPGQYAVIGPRQTTYIGEANPPATPPNSQTQWGIPAKSRAISLTPAVTVTPPAANAPTGAANPPLGIVVAADPPTATVPAWTGGQPIGLNISEPLPASVDYYQQPTYPNPNNPGVTDMYGDGTTQTFLDQPEDSDLAHPNRPLLHDNMLATATYSAYKYVFLQRLADPTAPYDAVRNPYVTVDWMPMDLTVFNGEQPPVPPPGLGSDPDDPLGASAQVSFSSRQRGGSNVTIQPSIPNVWSPLLSATQNTAQLQAGQSAPAAPDALPTPMPAYTPASINGPFTATFNQTLGFLNSGFGPPAAGPATATFNYAGAPKTQYPFPWIPWNARPYASLMELLMVPSSTPERLLAEFSYAPAGIGGVTTFNPYPQVASVPPYAYHSPFGNLLNFFNSTASNYILSGAPDFYRALEYMQVPSRFVGTETFLNPTAFYATNTDLNVQTFLPPFNKVSNFRDPGKVNLNTITSQNVWNALLNGMAHPQLSELVDSRRGYGAAASGLVVPNPLLPTYFSLPFRSPAAADCVPITSMMHMPVNSTLLRFTGATSPDSTSNNVPLFANFAAGIAPQSATNYNPNPYFRYQGFERISNMVTTRSNVFAVWLTIGYFEAIPWPGPQQTLQTGQAPIDAAHPDGYQIGAEIGSDTGEVERHRAFYMFDRSIPVGYERGQDHNVNRAILIKRYIE